MHTSFLKFRMTFTLTKYFEKSSDHDLDFPFTVRKELILNSPVSVVQILIFKIHSYNA